MESYPVIIWPKSLIDAHDSIHKDKVKPVPPAKPKVSMSSHKALLSVLLLVIASLLLQTEETVLLGLILLILVIWIVISDYRKRKRKKTIYTSALEAYKLELKKL